MADITEFPIATLDVETPGIHADALATALRAALKLDETAVITGGDIMVVNPATGEIGRMDAGDIVVTLPDGVVGIETVAELPTEGNYEGRIVFWTADLNLYRYNGSDWVRLIPDVTAELPEGTIGIERVDVLPALDDPANEDGRTVYLTTEKRLYIFRDGGWSPLVDIGDVTFPEGFTGVQNVAALPTEGNFDGRVVYLTTDKKLYRYVDPTGWTAAVAAVDITGTIGVTQISDGAISTPKLAANAVTTAKLAAGAVTATEIAANAVTADKILAGAVSAAKIDASAVTAEKIAAGSITTIKLAAGAVTATEIATNAVTADKVLAGAITAAKIDVNAVTAEKIAAGSITTIKFAAGSVTSNELAANSVIAGKIAAAAVTTGTIAAGAVTATHLAAGSVTATKISVTSLDAISANLGSITVDTINIAGNAVTVQAGAETAGAASINGTGLQQMQSVTVSWGASASVWVFFQFRVSTAEDLNLEIRSGGTVLASKTFRAPQDGNVIYMDMFPSGAASGAAITAWLKKTATGTASVFSRKLLVLAAKR